MYNFPPRMKRQAVPEYESIEDEYGRDGSNSFTKVHYDLFELYQSEKCAEKNLELISEDYQQQYEFPQFVNRDLKSISEIDVNREIFIENGPEQDEFSQFDDKNSENNQQHAFPQFEEEEAWNEEDVPVNSMIDLDKGLPKALRPQTLKFSNHLKPSFFIIYREHKVCPITMVGDETKKNLEEINQNTLEINENLDLIHEQPSQTTSKKQNRKFSFQNINIPELKFKLDDQTRIAVTSLNDLNAKKSQLAYYIKRGYRITFNKNCVLYTHHWNVSEYSKKYTCYIYCKHPLCRVLKAECKFLDNSIIVTFYRKNQQVATHVRGEQYTPQLRGPEREDKKQKLKVDYALNIQSDMNASISKSAADGGRIDTASLEVLRKARQEVNNEMYSDDELKNLINFSLDHREYVRGLRLLPIGVYTYNDSVIELIKDNEFEDTVYLDSTGQTSKTPTAEKRIMTYDMIGVHKATGKRVPIAHMLSERHRAFDIKIWLLEYLQGFVTKRATITFQSRIKRFVTDMSWSEIGAIISACNNFKSVKQYLDLCFLATMEEQSVNFTIIQLCHAHMMKIISNFIRKRTKEKKVISLFIDAMRAACKMESLQELNDWFASFAEVFGSKFKTSKTNTSLDFLKQQIELKNQDSDKIEINEGADLGGGMNIEEEITGDTNGNWSKFFHHFQAQFSACRLNTKKKGNKNPYYVSDKFMLDFIKKFMNIAPIWTNLMGKYCEGKQKTVSNAYVESWFKDLKYYVLNGIHDLNPTLYLIKRLKFEFGLIQYINNVKNGLHCSQKSKNDVGTRKKNLPPRPPRKIKI